eukprot:symbB.v1.2.017792.t1/scaffold1394.1/size200789/15
MGKMSCVDVAEGKIPTCGHARKSTSKLLEDTLSRTNQTLSFLQARYQSSGRPESTQLKENKECKEHPSAIKSEDKRQTEKDEGDQSHLQNRLTECSSGSRDKTAGGSGRSGSGVSESFASVSVRSGHWTKCEGYVSQDSRSTEDIDAKEPSSNLDEDLAEELMSVTFAKPLKPRLYSTSSEDSGDRPGQYVVIQDTSFSSETANFPGSEDGVAYIRAGTIVDVVEVGGQKPATVQGRILSPPGWICLLDTESGKRWACRAEAGEQKVGSDADFAPSTPRASLVVLPASKDSISTVCRKPRAKAIHRRAWPKDANAPHQLTRNAQPTGEFKA